MSNQNNHNHFAKNVLNKQFCELNDVIYLESMNLNIDRYKIKCKKLFLRSKVE
jgi:hypothetical protein